MQPDSSSPSFLTAVDSSQHHGSMAEQRPSASRASVQSLAVAFPGAYPSSISLVSIDTRQSTPPLVSSSDPHFPSPIHDPPRLRTPSVSSSATGLDALNMDPYVPPPQPHPQPPPPPRPRTPNIPRESLIRRIVAFFGYGSGTKARRHLISFLWTALLDGLQIGFSIVLLSLARATTSPTEPGLSEWDACGKPLGTWDAIWILRTALDFGLAYYHWSRQRRPNLVNADVERAHHQQAEILAPPRDVHDRPEQDGRGNRRENPAHAYPPLYSRLSAFCTMFTIVWFVMAHIFLFTSADTCRFSSPYIWWLSFAILSIMYFAVGEVILIAIVVFIIGPLLALLYAIIMLLLGRHPLRPLNYMEPDIRALPQNLVDKIPLVIYIPSPPDEPSSGPVTIPPEALVYPPKPRPGPTFIKKPRFRWLRAKKKASKSENKDDEGDPEKDPEKEDGMEADGQRQAWEDNWERGDYPFVRLEDNRATCAICLLDFEEPPRKPNANPGEVAQPIMEEANADSTGEAPVQSPAMEPNPAGLRLEDAEEGDQILRLLACGHVFHQSCVDPWLTGVSGRCPTCQCKVEIPRERRKRWRYGRRRRPDPPPLAP